MPIHKIKISHGPNGFPVRVQAVENSFVFILAYQNQHIPYPTRPINRKIGVSLKLGQAIVICYCLSRDSYKEDILNG